MQGLGILIEVLALIIDFQWFKDVKEDDIERNIKVLKQYTWFQDLLKQDEYRKLIIHDQQVRKVIGRFNTEKLAKDFYNARSHEKLEKVLLKQL